MTVILVGTEGWREVTAPHLTLSDIGVIWSCVLYIMHVIDSVNFGDIHVSTVKCYREGYTSELNIKFKLFC